MRKLLLFLDILVVFVLMLTVVNADTFSIKQNENIQFIKTCTNSTANICSSIATCNITIRSPINNTYIINNRMMTNNLNGQFNISLISSMNSVRGIYEWDMFCCDSTDCGEAHGTYSVTTDGENTSSMKAGVSISMIVLLIFLFVLTIFVYGRLPSKTSNSNDGGGLDYNNLKYFRPVIAIISYLILVAIVFISSNISYLFIDNNLIGDLLFRFFLIMAYAIVPLFVILFLYGLVQYVNDKRFKNMYERGFDFGGNQL